MRKITRVELDTSLEDSGLSFLEYQSLYLDQNIGDLKPNTEVWICDKLHLQINSLGCKGPELQPGKPVIGVFGDSGSFSICGVEAWPSRINIPGYQILNASVEGYSLERMLEKYQKLRQQLTFSGLIIYGGWHNLVYGQTGPAFWRSIFDQFRADHKLVICTLLCSLIDECRTRGVDELLCTQQQSKTENRPFFEFWGDAKPTKELINQGLDALATYNRFLKSYCAETGAILLDLHTYMLPRSYQEIPLDFFDIHHPNVHTYSKLAMFATKMLTPHFTGKALSAQFQTEPPISNSSSTAAKDQQGKGGSRQGAHKHNIYPIW